MLEETKSVEAPVTVVLKEGKDGDPEWTLRVMKAVERARVELRTARVRMTMEEIGPPDLIDEVLGTADDLEVIQGRLRRLAHEVPEPPDAMLEHEIPYNFHADLLTTLECVAEDDLDGAIGKLRTAASADPRHDSRPDSRPDGWGEPVSADERDARREAEPRSGLGGGRSSAGTEASDPGARLDGE